MELNQDTHPIKKDYPFPNNWSDREYFLYACFVPDLQVFYNEWIEQGGKKKGRIQYFDILPDGRLEHKYWKPSNKCCQSGELLTNKDIDIKASYWTPNLWKPIRKDLLAEAKKAESFECQNIDCSCNDCKWLNRADSWCTKFDKKTRAEVNIACPENINCFEHRRS